MDGYYIADKKIATVTVLEDRTTPSGEKIVNVLFEDHSVETMPLLRLETISTELVSDASTVQTTLQKKVASMLFLTLHEYGIKMGEVNGIVDATVDLTTNGYHKFRDIIAGVEYLLLPLNNINDVLIKNAKSTEEKDNDGAASSGSGLDSSHQG